MAITLTNPTSIPAATPTQWVIQSLTINYVSGGDFSANITLAQGYTDGGGVLQIPVGTKRATIFVPSVNAEAGTNANFAAAFVAAESDAIAAINAYFSAHGGDPSQK